MKLFGSKRNRSRSQKDKKQTLERLSRDKPEAEQVALVAAGARRRRRDEAEIEIRGIRRDGDTYGDQEETEASEVRRRLDIVRSVLVTNSRTKLNARRRGRSGNNNSNKEAYKPSSYHQGCLCSLMKNLMKMLTTIVLLTATLGALCGLAVVAIDLGDPTPLTKVTRIGRSAASGLRTALAPQNRQQVAAGSEFGGEQNGLALGRQSQAPTAIKNITAQNGQSVLLHCLVEPSDEEQIAVSWFRGTGELQLLSYESNTVIQDQRFIVRHGSSKGDDWALQIKNLDKSTDSGLYQCQTNSEPPQSQYYQLNIVEPQVHIQGAPDLAVKLGAAINLTCVISQSPDQLQFIFWYRDDRMINYDLVERGKIVVSKWPQKADTITSNLQIFNSKLSDSGNYTCMPSGARPMSIYVHVLEGLDKRLIMFQNDYEPSAASSQQSNSAISVHVVRLTRGRVYALFVAFIIFTSWFQLVAQAQTAISLLLLAIIGYFLGKVTDNNGHNDELTSENGRRTGRSHYGEEEEEKEGANDEVKKKKAANRSDDEDEDPPGKTAKRNLKLRRGQRDGGKSLSSASFDEAQSSPTGSANSSTTNETQTSASTIDPLIKRANSALNLLKTLSSGSGSSDDDDSSCSASSRRRRQQQHQTERDRKGPQETKSSKPLTSPSAASSSASTGYNSDTRSAANLNYLNSRSQEAAISHMTTANATPQAASHLLSADGRLCDGEDNMIELVSQPTALRLIMDEFSGTRSPSSSLTGTTNDISESEEPHYSSPSTPTLGSLVSRRLTSRQKDRNGFHAIAADSKKHIPSSLQKSLASYSTTSATCDPPRLNG